MTARDAVRVRAIAVDENQLREFDVLMANPTRTVRVALADDHPVVLVAVSDTLAGMPGYHVEGAAHSGAELLQLLDTHPVDLVVTDLSMQGDEPEFDGLRLVSRIRRAFPDTAVVVFTMLTNGGIFHELCKIGVAAIVSKEEGTGELSRICMRALVEKEPILSPKIVQRLARDGSTTTDLKRSQPLSPRELEVVRLFARGLSVTEIARSLNRSVPTIATQKRSAMRKLHVENHVDLVKYATEIGLS